MSAYTDGTIEPVVNTTGLVNPTDDALLSIAVSLKRIADALDAAKSQDWDNILYRIECAIQNGLQQRN